MGSTSMLRERMRVVRLRVSSGFLIRIVPSLVALIHCNAQTFLRLRASRVAMHGIWVSPVQLKQIPTALHRCQVISRQWWSPVLVTHPDGGGHQLCLWLQPVVQLHLASSTVLRYSKVP